MKKLLFIGIAVCAWISVAAQGSTMQFVADSWDFGTIKESGGKVSHRFEFTNTGDKPFVIEKVETTCGCTTPTFSRVPILPARKGYVEITYDPTNRPGQFRREVTVTSNDRKNSNKLIVIGTVIGRARAPQEEFPVDGGGGLRLGRTVVGIGYVPRGGTKSGAVEYYNVSQQPVTLGVVYDTPAVLGFSVAFSSPQLPPGARGVMTLSFDLRTVDLWGRLTPGFHVTVNGVKSPVRMSATGIAVDDFTAWTPDRIARGPKADFTAQYYHFGDVKAGEEREKSFTVTNVGQEPLVIRHVDTGKRMSLTLKAGTVIAPGGSVTFTGKLRTQGVEPGRLMETATIILNDPQRTMRELRLTANVI